MVLLDMAKLTKDEILSSINGLLERPGVCAPEKRAAVLETCQSLSEEQLTGVAATLRIQYQNLVHLARSPEKMKQVKNSMRELDALLQKYAIQP